MSYLCMFIRLAAAYFAASVIGFGCRSIIAAMTIDELLVNVIEAFPFRTGASFTAFSSYGHAVGADSLWSFAVMSLISAGILFMMHASAFVVAEKVVGIFARPRIPDMRSLTGDPLPALRFRAMTRSAWFGVYALPLALVVALTGSLRGINPNPSRTLGRLLYNSLCHLPDRTPCLSMALDRSDFRLAL